MVYNLQDQRFGSWQVLEKAERKGLRGELFWSCVCDCGTTRDVQGTTLRNRQSQSCGCVPASINRERLTTHGLSKTIEYQTWCSMKGRCENPNIERYPHYGGRGISVCDRWRESFETFLADMGPRPSPEYSIDRIDPDGNYEPGNCRWVTADVQASNTSRRFIVTFDGRSQPLAAWARETGIAYDTLQARLKYYGWDVERSLTTPVTTSRCPR